MTTIDAKGIYYRQLNEQIKKVVKSGEKHIVLNKQENQVVYIFHSNRFIVQIFIKIFLFI